MISLQEGNSEFFGLTSKDIIIKFEGVIHNQLGSCYCYTFQYNIYDKPLLGHAFVYEQGVSYTFYLIVNHSILKYIVEETEKKYQFFKERERSDLQI